MARPLGFAMLLVPATSCQQITHLVWADPAVGKPCVITLGHSNCKRATFSSVTVMAVCALAIEIKPPTSTAPKTQCHNRKIPLIGVALLPVQLLFPSSN